MDNTKFANRLMQVVYYKTGGNKRKFGELLGWSAQYTQKICSGEAIGLNPIESIANTFSDINIRWLITGEGSMFDVLGNRLATWIRLERYIPVMTDEERNRVDVSQQYTLEDINRWENLLLAAPDRSQRIAEAISRQTNLS